MKLLDLYNNIMRLVSIVPNAKRRTRHSAHEALEARTMLTTAVADSYYANSSAATTIPAAQGVLANDTGSGLTAVLVSNPYFGYVTFNSDGSFTYTNTSSSPGDQITYKDWDGTSYSNTVAVSLTLSSNGAAPHAVNDTIGSVTHDRTLNVSAPGVLSNDGDPNHLPLTSVLDTGPSHGSVTLNADGSLSYAPALHYVGADSFTYEDDNGQQTSSPATVSLTVTNNTPGATNDTYALPNGATFNVSAAGGVLANDGDLDGDTLTASLSTEPTHGSLTLNSDGSFSYTPDVGWVGIDTFTYTTSDGIATSSPATVSLHTQYSVLSAVDETKVPVDTINVSRQILSDPFNSPITSPLPAGGSGGTTISAAPADGAPATAHNLSLLYNSVLAQPDAVIEANIGLSNAASMSDTLAATLTFNGTAQPATYFNMAALNGTDSHVHFAQQVDLSAMSSGRYPWSLTVTSPDMASPATVSGFVNVVNDSASAFGKGWDMPGLMRLFSNSVSGVPAGMLLSPGDGGAWYYTQGSGSSYGSPAGPYAFSTLTSVTGGWQLVTHEGVTFNFNSSGYLTSRVERTGETTSYTWTSGTLTAITDQFGRAVNLGYTSGLLSSIEDFATSTWTVAHTGSNLTSITEPDPGGGSPVWQYAYSGNYLSSVTDPNSNVSGVTLDSYHRISGTSLPGGASTSATSEQDFGYGSTSSGSPANITLQTSVTPSDTDTLGNTSYSQTDTFGNTTSSTDAYGYTTVIARDANGLPTTLTQPSPDGVAAAPVSNIYYNSTGDETYATGAHPTYGKFTYNTFGEWATFTDISGHEWTRTFDSYGDILTEDDPSGNEVSWTYTTYGQPATMTLPAPNNATGTVTTHYYYDSDDRLTEIVWPDSSTIHLGYNSDDRQTTYEDENSHTTTTAIDVLGRDTSVTNAASGVVLTTYDKNNNVLTTEDQLGNIVTSVWNSSNELIEQDLPDPDGTGPLAAPVLYFTYSAAGQELTSTDGLGRVTTKIYDDMGRLIETDLPDPDGSGPLTSPTITTAYDRISRPVSQTDALGNTTVMAYGNTDVSQATSVTAPDPDGGGPLTAPVTSYSFDADGRRSAVEDALGHTTTTAFTVDGQTASVEDNLSNITAYAYGHGGELLTSTDALSHATSQEFDSRYRLVQTTDANSGVTQITLDPAGNRTAMVDSASNETDWTFDALNRPVTETNSGGTTTISYNASSDITKIVDADGRDRVFGYDNLHRLTAENWMSGSTLVASTAYSYDAANQLVLASDGNSSYTFAYDGDGNVLTTDNAGTPSVPRVVLTGAFDAAGNRTSLSATIAGTADLLNSYSYDADQRMTTLTQQGQSGGSTVSPKEVDFAYNALGQSTSIADFNTLSGPRSDVATGAYSYDLGNRLTGLAYTSNGGATSIDTFGWSFNAGNLVTTFTSNDGEADYGYDPTNQLTSATYTTATGGHQPANESNSFDANGNRSSTGYSTAADNLMTSDGTFNYTHDADGNTTSRTRISSATASDYLTTYSWDYRNRLTDVEYYDNSSVLTKHVHYVYDVFDHLLSTQVDTTGSGSYNQVEYYVLDVSPEIPSAGVPGTALAQPLLQFDGSGNLTTRYLEAHDRIFAQGAVAALTSGDTVNWDLVDNLGSVRDVLDDLGNVLDQLAYNSFGQVAYESAPAVHHFDGYTGGHYDPNTGAVDNYHRWYDPATGGWMSQDPKGFSAKDNNLSRYVGNDVTARSDPSGLKWVEMIVGYQPVTKTINTTIWRQKEIPYTLTYTYNGHTYTSQETKMVVVQQQYSYEQIIGQKPVKKMVWISDGQKPPAGTVEVTPVTDQNGNTIGWDIYIFNGSVYVFSQFEPTGPVGGGGGIQFGGGN